MTDDKPRGTCKECGRTFRVRDGVVVFHRQRGVFITPQEYQWPQPPCPGWGYPPVVQEDV